MGAVADRRRLLLEAQPAALGRPHGRDRPAHVASGPDLGGDRRDQPLVGRQLAQIVLEPVAAQVAHDRGHLYLMHREDHRGRRAAPAELQAGLGDRAERQAATAVFGRHERRQRSHVPQRGDRLLRKARFTIDFVDVALGYVIGQFAYRGEELLVAVDRNRHAASTRSSHIAETIAAIVSKTLRLSIWSGNSVSKRSSRASITLTLACELIPAWNRSAWELRVSTSTRRRAWSRSTSRTPASVTTSIGVPPSELWRHTPMVFGISATILYRPPSDSSAGPRRAPSSRPLPTPAVIAWRGGDVKEEVITLASAGHV